MRQDFASVFRRQKRFGKQRIGNGGVGLIHPAIRFGIRLVLQNLALLAHCRLDLAVAKPPGGVHRRRNGEKYKGRVLILRRGVQDIGYYPFCPFADKPPDIGNRILRLGLLKQRVQMQPQQNIGDLLRIGFF